jgi:tetratricopeptide (TPR) repeat protein
MSEHEHEKIKPVDFDISQSPIFSAQSNQAVKNSPSPVLWFGLGLLVIVALAVIFVLPGIVSEYELPLEPRADVIATTSAPANTTSQPVVNAISPFEEAQKSLRRKEAQDALAELLNVQAQLTAANVDQWATQEYTIAIEFARTGDQAYLEQDFVVARDDYLAGTQALESIFNSIPVILEQHLIDAEAALAANDSTVALQKFEIALALESTNSQAQTGLSRARALDEVNSLLTEADTLSSNGDLENARKLYLDALNLDPRHTVTQNRIEQINQQILENAFSSIMSQGYAALQNDQPEQAIETFERAIALGVNQAQAQAAIQQTQDEVARVTIERFRANAESAQENEQWQQAVQAYAGVLAIDPNIVFAQEGKDYSEKRQRLDDLLDYAIANPERLADDNVYQQSEDIFYTGRNLESPGPRLQAQLNELETLLETSQLPMPVAFVSDNLTRVSLLRVSELGMFESQSLTLKPGRYIAVGSREGYRDVREEFVVRYGQTPPTVVIKCDERIVATRGR